MESNCYRQREAGEGGLRLLVGGDRDARSEDAAPLPAGKESHTEPGW